MGNFNRDRGSRGGRRSDFGGRRSFGRNGNSGFGRGRNDKQMFDAVCGNCGKDCQVPFRPTGSKPVYCSDCFEKMGGRDERGSFDRSDRGGRSHSDDRLKVQLESVNAKLDKILDLLQPKEVPADLSPTETVVEVPAKKKAKSSKSKKLSTKKTSKETK